MLLKITLISNIEIILNYPPYNCDENRIIFIILMNLYLIFYFNIPVDYWEIWIILNSQTKIAII